MTSVHIALFLKLPLHVVGLREGSHSTSKVSRTDKTDSNRRFLCIVSSVLMTQFRCASKSECAPATYSGKRVQFCALDLVSMPCMHSKHAWTCCWRRKWLAGMFCIAL